MEVGKVSSPTAFITGITGQDGSYLAEHLLAQGYKVHGLTRRHSSLAQAQNLSGIWHDPNLFLHAGDIRDPARLQTILKEVRPHYIFHLAAQSHVGESFASPALTFETNATGTINLLEAMRQAGLKNTRIYNASSSEIFGNNGIDFCNEASPKKPCSP